MGDYKVYKHIFPNGKVYIGMTKQQLKKRFGANGNGYKQCPAIYNAIKNYGWENVKHILLYDGLSKEEAERKEIELIANYKSNLKQYGYNIENGGNCCGTHSAETKKKISIANKGRVFSNEAIEKMKKAHKGKQAGKENPFYGKKHTEECKIRQSKFMQGNQYNRGHHHTEEFKKKKSKQMHEKYKDGGSPLCKPVLEFDDKGVLICRYYSLSDAAKKQGVCKAAIHKWIYDCKNARWQYEK